MPWRDKGLPWLKPDFWRFINRDLTRSRVQVSSLQSTLVPDEGHVSHMKYMTSTPPVYLMTESHFMESISTEMLKKFWRGKNENKTEWNYRGSNEIMVTARIFKKICQLPIFMQSLSSLYLYISQIIDLIDCTLVFFCIVYSDTKNRLLERAKIENCTLVKNIFKGINIIEYSNLLAASLNKMYYQWNT